MKLVKMSLAAAVLLGASAFAIENVKVDGDAKLYYGTNNADYSDLNGNNPGTVKKSGLFDKGASAADAALRLSVTGDLLKGVSFGVTGYAISTLGLENNLVDKTWSGAHGVTVNNGASYANAALGGAQANDAAWIGEVWMAATLGKTTAKVGRMELDTPLAFSEKWSVVPNTFEAAVILNQDIPDTTLVGAWVGKGNGTNPGVGFNNRSALDTLGLAYDGGVVGAAADFHTFANGGAYAAAIVNNSYKPLTAQAWYYNVVNVADAFWLQADVKCKLLPGVIIGAQYAEMDPKGLLTAAKNSTAYAGKLGYEGIEGLVVFGAYSKTDKDGTLKIANVGTNNLGTAQSKLYTEAYWNYGYVGAPGAESFNLTAEYDIKDVVKVGAYYTDVNVRALNAMYSTDLQEFALTASKSFGPLEATLAYIYTDATNQNEAAVVANPGYDGRPYDSILAMLKLNF